MTKGKTGSKLLVLLLAAFMLVAYVPLLGAPVYADTNDGVISEGMDNMMWGENISPRVISSGDKLFWGYMKNDGTRGVASYDEASGVVTTDFVKPYSNRTIDNLSTAVLLTEDKKIMCAYPQDTAAQKTVHIRVSDAAEDISAFGSDVTVNVGGSAAYNVQLLESSGKYYMFCRISDGAWTYSTSEDGVTWSAVKRFLSESKMRYNCKFVTTTAAGIIRVLMCSEPDGTNPEIRMGFLDTSTNTVYSDAALTTDVTSKVNTSGSVTKLFENFPVVQSPEDGKTMSLMDVAVTAPDAPRFIFASFTNAAGTNDYKYMLHDSGKVSAFGESESALLDPTVPLGAAFRGSNDIVVISSTNGKDYITLDTVVNKRASYAGYLYVHDASETRAARPVVDASGKALMWLEGTYTSATNYNTSARLMKLNSMLTPDVSIDKDYFIYNGSVQKPVVTIVGLTEGTDYDIEWSDPESKEPGKYELTIKFKGAQAGQPDIGIPYDIVEDSVSTTVATDKTEYELGEAINVTCSTEDTTGGWIGVYDEGTTVNPESHSTPAYIWYYPAKGGVESTQNLNAITDSGNFGNGYAGPPLGAGNYKVVYLSGSYEVLAQANFTVTMKPSTLSVDKRVYKVNEPIKVTATSDYDSAWVGFYPYRGGDPLDNGDLKAYYYLSDFETDTVDIINDEAVTDKDKVKDLPDGRYKVILFTSGWSIDDSRGTMCIESFYVYDPDKLFTWYEEDGEWKAYATFTDQGPTEIDAVVTAVTTDATCSAAGKTVYTATVDADAIDGAITGSLAATLKTAATFTGTKTVEIPALEHDYQEVADTAKAATCTEAGKEADKKCSLCGDVVTGAEIPALGHDYQEVADTAKAATCTEAGKEADKKCSRCEDVVAGAEIPALDHDWGEWTEAEPSTCIKQGQLVRECKRDPEHKEYKDADLAAHKLEKTDAKEATCTEAGNIEFWHCTVCDKLFKDEEGLNEIAEADTVVAALGHNMTAHEAKEATREAEGNSAYWSCDRCSKFFSDAEGKTEIADGDWVIKKLEPTEEEKAAKEELDKAVDEAKKVEQGNYTDESFKALQDAIAEAEALSNDVNATKEQLDAAAAKIADAKAALKDKEPEVGTEAEYSGNTYAVTSEPGAEVKTVAFTKAKNSKTVTVPSTMKINGETYKVTSVAAKAFKGSKCTTAYIGANVKKLDKYAFRYSKVKTVYIKSKLLSKTRVKGSLKYSKVTTVKAKVSTKKSTNKKYAKKFKSYFTKANAGKKVTVKY